MLVDQDKLMTKICSFNNDVIMQKPSSFGVSDFLNNPSPRKKRKASDLDGHESMGGVDDGSESCSSAANLTEVSNK